MAKRPRETGNDRVGDYRNKLKREADAYWAWCRRNDELLVARLRAGERFRCQCGAVEWGTGAKISHVVTVGKPEAFYCPACMPAGIEKNIRDLRRMYGSENFDERPDAKQLGLFGEYDPGLTVIRPKK